MHLFEKKKQTKEAYFTVELNEVILVGNCSVWNAPLIREGSQEVFLYIIDKDSQKSLSPKVPNSCKACRWHSWYGDG